ncbi:hypothetical protein WOLCODRAFT_68879 [Wolfiporia cocos MD-104 SS10]|uniref:Alpha/gamma-adaptin-binding protein p34 n=1 Tax=Wolfiporia cocos (strain MD-104) TaxID=742152 RepID=A0A2H3JEL3_WOLCO|nr:hypothetical protein WOLCODRAFT_68879 [Wolfiporia cocos MD-104 SS10]
MASTAECRILVISSKVEQAQQFVQRVQALSTAKPSISLSSADESNGSIPWTIANKYYTANVHFQTRVLNEFKSSHADGVPAVVFVWMHGEPFREHILDISSSLRDHDPEVSLAVKLGTSATAEQSAKEEGTDDFLSSHGFEYIEGDRTSTAAEEGIPGLPRAIDALSTIMWPTIVQSESTRNRKSRARELLDWAREEEEEDGLRALISGDDSAHAHDDADPGADTSTTAVRKSRMQREMEELERWLADEEGRREREEAHAWVGWSSAPTPTIQTPTVDGVPHLRFDDDFTEFVAAPSPASAQQLAQSLSPFDADMLVPMHTGASYRSLASVSDIGSDHHATDGDGDGDDPDLPSQAEIAETSRRIFGSAFPLPVPDISRPSASAETASAHGSDDGHAFDHHDDDDEFEMSAFDLSRVLSALQGMKEQISGMEDEGERRKAAARVALGLVYGLQADGRGSGN